MYIDILVLEFGYELFFHLQALECNKPPGLTTWAKSNFLGPILEKGISRVIGPYPRLAQQNAERRIHLHFRNADPIQALYSSSFYLLHFDNVH